MSMFVVDLNESERMISDYAELRTKFEEFLSYLNNYFSRNEGSYSEQIIPLLEENGYLHLERELFERIHDNRNEMDKNLSQLGHLVHCYHEVVTNLTQAVITIPKNN